MSDSLDIIVEVQTNANDLENDRQRDSESAVQGRENRLRE